MSNRKKWILYVCTPLLLWTLAVCKCHSQTFPQVGSSIPGNGYTLTLFCSANQSPAINTTYFIGSCPGLPLNTTYSTAQVDIPKAGRIKRVFYKVRIGTVDTSEANGVVHSIRLNNTTDLASQTFAYTQVGTNVINSAINQAVVAGDTLVLKVVTPAAWAVSPLAVHHYVVLYIE